MSKLGDHSVTFKKGKEKVTFNFSHGKIWGFRDNNNNLFRADKPSSKCYVVLTSGKICFYGTPALVKIYQAPNGSTNYYLQKGMSLQKTLAISKGDTGEIFPIDNEILVQIFGDDSELLEKIKNDKVRTGIGTDLDADFPKILAWVAEYNSRN